MSSLLELCSVWVRLSATTDAESIDTAEHAQHSGIHHHQANLATRESWISGLETRGEFGIVRSLLREQGEGHQRPEAAPAVAATARFTMPG